VSVVPVILAIDTSQGACSVALGRGGDLIGSAQIMQNKGHAESLLPMTETLLANEGLTFADIDRIAVVIGPGAYTGVRIGVAAARGLAVALKIPSVGVTGLHALAHACADSDGSILATVAGRGGTLFAQLFAGGEAQSEPAMMTLEAARSLQKKSNAVVVGSGRVQLGIDASLTSEHMIDLASVAAIAVDLVPADAPSEPMYLRDADAIIGKPVFPIGQVGDHGSA